MGNHLYQYKSLYNLKPSNEIFIQFSFIEFHLSLNISIHFFLIFYFNSFILRHTIRSSQYGKANIQRLLLDRIGV